MTREERLKYLARQLYEAKKTERDATDDTKAIRDEFFRLLDDGIKNKTYSLPVKTIEVPESFFVATGMTMKEFVESRFPNWEVVHIEKNTAHYTTVIVLKQKHEFVPGVVEVDDGDRVLRVSKEISEYTPEIDWETLKAERPDLFKKIAKRVYSYEINEQKFSRLIDEEPEELATLQRHMTVRQPTIRATARRIKKDDGEE